MSGVSQIKGQSMAGAINTDANSGKILPILQKLAPVIAVVVTALIFSKAIFGDFTNFDDDVFILNNALIKDMSWESVKTILTSISAGKYQPFTNLTFAIEHHFFGFSSVVFHLDNVLLHLLSTWVLFVLVKRISGNIITAFVVSLLFGIHPMHVEEVAWASERKDVLYALFYLLSLLFYVKYIGTGYRSRYYVMCFLFFIASLLSKSEAITLPLLLIAIDIYKNRKINIRTIGEKLPLLAFSVAAIILSVISQHSDGGLGQVSAASYGFVNRIFLFTTIPSFYIVKLFLPFRLSAMHYYPDMHNGMLPWMYYVSLPFAVTVTWFLMKKDRLSNDKIFGAMFFAITICVMPQLVSVGPSLTPERYSYIPYIGLMFIVGQWLSGFTSESGKKIAWGIFAGFALMFCILSWLRIDVWRNSEVLLTDIIEKNKDVADCSYLYWVRGNSRMEENSVAEAIQDYTEAIAQHPNYLEAYSNRAGAYFQTGDIRSAILDYDKTLRISPNHAKSYYNRAAGKASIGDFSGALFDFNEYLKRIPGDARALTDRGMVRYSLKDTAGACADWKLASQAGSPEAAQFLQQLGR